jgi:DNA-binding NarL/FixJ family response regulator
MGDEAVTAPGQRGPEIRVIVADDHGVVREGIRHVLEGQPGFRVVAEAVDGDEVLRQVEAHQPDVVVLDVTMPGESGLKVAAKLRARFPDTRVLMLSMHEHAEYVAESVRAGAHGYLLKDTAPQELRDAIRAVHRGESYFSARVVGKLPGAPRRDSPGGSLALLTPRERDVLAGIAGGKTNKEIAAAFGISHRTVEAHRESLMRKVSVHTVAGLTRLALEAGLIVA